ncbi:MAG: AbrB family transcriptional regulator [Cyanobacteria bacterium J06642_2]
MNYLWTLAIALLGGFIGMKLRIPAGALVGAAFAVGSANVLGAFDLPPIPSQTRFVLQVGLGILLGATLDRETVVAMRELWRPALMCAAIAISTGVFSGLAISRLLGMEPLTALLGTAPGGLSDISLIALDMGAQGSTVLIMHLTRLISVIAIVPWIVRAIARMGATAG